MIQELKQIEQTIPNLILDMIDHYQSQEYNYDIIGYQQNSCHSYAFIYNDRKYMITRHDHESYDIKEIRYKNRFPV